MDLDHKCPYEKTAFFERKGRFPIRQQLSFSRFLRWFFDVLCFCEQLASTFEHLRVSVPKRMRTWGGAKLGQMAKPLFPRTPWSAGARWRMQQKFTQLQLSYAFRLHHQGLQIVAAEEWHESTFCLAHGMTSSRSAAVLAAAKHVADQRCLGMFREIGTRDMFWASRKSRLDPSESPWPVTF